jgi:hypothetical protein
MFHWVVDPGAEGAGAGFAAFEEHQPQAHLIAELAPLDFPSTGLCQSLAASPPPCGQSAPPHRHANVRPSAIAVKASARR